MGLKISTGVHLKIADNNTTANYNLGNALYRKENTDEAVRPMIIQSKQHG